MVTRGKLHTVKAASASVRIDKAEPNASHIRFRLSSGDHLEVGMNRHVLERILVQAKRAIEAAPFLGPKHLSHSSVTSRNE
jgi:hypothetical protein